MPTAQEILTDGFALHRAGRRAEAMALYCRVLAAVPSHAGSWYLLGTAAFQEGRAAQAADWLRCAITLDPALIDAHLNLAHLCRDAGRSEEAEQCYRRVTTLQPDHRPAHEQLGLILYRLGRVGAAEKVFRAMLALKPDLPNIWSNLGGMLKVQGRLGEAIAAYRQALTLEPAAADAHDMLGKCLREQGRLDEAVASYRRALDVRPELAGSLSDLLMGRQYQTGVTAAHLQACHAEWEERFGRPRRDAWRDHANERDHGRRLRVGMVSADFGRHPIGYFVLRLLENLDRDAVAVVGYSDRPFQDARARRLRQAAAGWVECQGLDDDALAERIRADGIDILFDLAGHTGQNRLRVFARRPAPIQITWAGYVGTTGLASMDYLLADRFHVPAGEEPLYAERVLRLPDGYICYDPPEDAPAVGPLPALRNGAVTFGCFNNLTKITPEVVAVWSALLRRVPESRLMLKAGPLADPPTRRRFEDLFADHGIAAHRLDLRPGSPHVVLLDTYNAIDIALDPFPYSGGLTTCEALWMGVPVVTCPGQTFAGRHSFSHLSNVGLTETIATSLDDYVDRAAALAQDLAGLAALRASLRARMAASALCDGPRFARHVEILLRQVWGAALRDGLPPKPAQGDPGPLSF